MPLVGVSSAYTGPGRLSVGLQLSRTRTRVGFGVYMYMGICRYICRIHGSELIICLFGLVREAIEHWLDRE